MKALHVVVASLVAGVLAGAGITWAHFGHAPPLAAAELITAPVAAGKRAPKVVVDKWSHDFGLIDRRDTVQQAFRFTNIGDGVLTLKPGKTTCSACTIAELERAEVLPGESAEVVVEYSPRTAKPEFTQYAVILTNDPEQPRVELKITGSVTSRMRVLPDQLVLSNASASNPTTAEFKVYYYLGDKLRVADYKFAEPRTAEYFEAQIEPIGADELELDAKSGCRVLVTLNPGLPLGPFRQTIRLTLESGDAGERTQLDLPISGAVVSDLSIVGPGWRNAAGLLKFDEDIKSEAGARRTLYVLVRGEARHDVEIEPIKLDPPWLEVTLGEPEELNESVVRIPLIVEIPPGRPPAIHLGTDQGDYGEIILGVKNHPHVKEMRMRVSFAIGD